MIFVASAPGVAEPKPVWKLAEEMNRNARKAAIDNTILLLTSRQYKKTPKKTKGLKKTTTLQFMTLASSRTAR
jgi:hypothetical protein